MLPNWLAAVLGGHQFLNIDHRLFDFLGRQTIGKGVLLDHFGPLRGTGASIALWLAMRRQELCNFAAKKGRTLGLGQEFLPILFRQSELDVCNLGEPNVIAGGILGNRATPVVVVATTM